MKNKKFKEFICWLGSFIFIVILLSLPALTALSYALNFPSIFRFILTIVVVIEAFGLTDFVEN